MSPLSRALSLALLLLAVFLCVALGLQWWLQRETDRLQSDSLTAKRAQLAEAVAMMARPPEKWDEDFKRQLGILLGGRITLTGVPTVTIPGQLAVEATLPGHAGVLVRLEFTPPAAGRILALHRRVVAATVLLALLLVMVPLLLVLPRRGTSEGGTNVPWQKARSEMSELTHFARVSTERGEELQRESGARQRAEQDLQVSRTMLNQSQEERAQLGRELHDNICQTLYAVSLTLDSVRKRMNAEPELAQRLELCQTEMRRLNQQVRSYLSQLEPDEIARETFADALEQMLDVMTANRDIEVVRQLENETLAHIPPEQAIGVVSILREAISNAVRHGGAKRLTVRAERGDTTVILAVQDDGSGFTPSGATSREGHGLANMEARAAALGGSLRVESVPGKGTRVLLLLPVASA
ncbi:MAG: sensor histidine kinase [Opitutae bacterium]|nr:sensor histidine kinase [Opitutae bacterium]